jgi:hypothetical protein
MDSATVIIETILVLNTSKSMQTTLAAVLLVNITQKRIKRFRGEEYEKYT